MVKKGLISSPDCLLIPPIEESDGIERHNDRRDESDWFTEFAASLFGCFPTLTEERR